MHHAAPPPSRGTVRRSIATVGVAAVATLGLGGIPATGVVDDDGNVVIDIVGINDFHGRIARELDRNGAVTQPGAVAMASAVERIRAENEDTLFVSAGDNFGASTFVSMINDDVPTLQALAAMELDASALGNHEFDQGTATLHERINGRPADPDADPSVEAWDPAGFPYLAANVTRDGVQEFEPTAVVQTVNGVDVGFVGALTPAMRSLVSPAGIEGLDFGNMAEAVAEAATELESTTDVIVVLVHDGSPTPDLVDITNPGTPFGELVNSVAANPSIDAIFSGHTHEGYQQLIPRDDAAPLPVVQTGSFGDVLGRVTLTVDEESGEVTEASAAMLQLGQEPLLEGNDVVDAVAAIVDAAVAEAELLGARPVGEIDRTLHRAQQTSVAENRGGESTIGNLIADAQLWALAQQFPDDPADIAFMNPGGIRADIVADDEGVVTYRDVATAQPFGNTLVTLDLTGYQIVEVLEEQWQPVVEGGRPFLKLGVSEGLFYFYDPLGDPGERVTHVFFNEEPLDLDATYRVVTNSFLAAGGDNFGTFAEGGNHADSGLVDLAAFVSYFEATDRVAAPLGQRAVGVHWVSDQVAVYTPGDEIEIDLSSLLFGTDEPKTEVLALELYAPGSAEALDLGTVEIDPAIVDTTDEVGRAQVRVAVPELQGLGDAPEEWTIVAYDELTNQFYEFGVYLAAADDATPAPTPTLTTDPTTPAPTSPPASPKPTAPGGDLPSTGAETNAPLIAGAALVLLGSTLVVAVRRRGSLME